MLSRAVSAGSERNIATARSHFGAALASAQDEKDGQAELEVVLAWSAMELRFRYDINPALLPTPHFSALNVMSLSCTSLL